MFGQLQIYTLIWTKNLQRKVAQPVRGGDNLIWLNAVYPSPEGEGFTDLLWGSQKPH